MEATPPPLTLDPADRRRLVETAARFAPLRARFAHPGAERGGHVRAGFTPIYARLAGAHAATLFAAVDHHHVESSFSPDQLAAVQHALVLLRHVVNGATGGPALADQLARCYLERTRPAFRLALLRALEGCLDTALATHPAEAAVFDAIMRVAGGEGLRDLVCFFGAHLLEETLAGTRTPFPDLTALVAVHERRTVAADGRPRQTRAEIWCPGTDLARAIFAQAETAAQALVARHGVTFALSTREEAALLPADLPAGFTRRVQQQADAILALSQSAHPAAPAEPL